jgi:hypothetical protein
MGQCEESKGGVEIGGYDKREMSSPDLGVSVPCFLEDVSSSF